MGLMILITLRMIKLILMMEIPCIEICKQYQVSKAEKISSSVDKIQNGLN